MSDRPWISVEDKLPFYFEGKYFDNEEDFFKWVKEWQFLSLDQETAEIKLDNLKKDILMNIFFRGIKFTNNDFVIFLNKIFEFAMKELQNDTD